MDEGGFLLNGVGINVIFTIHKSRIANPKHLYKKSMAKKNQYYIPKFYLKYFSFQKNQREIGILNLKNNFFKKNVALRDQCSSKYFYGEDEVIENYLSKLEGYFAQIFRNIIENEEINKKNKKELYELLTFVLFTDLRSLTTIENLKNLPNRLNELNLDISFSEISQQESVKITFSNVKAILPFILDLDYKLLKNKTNTKFISSDYPIAKYNLLYENVPTYFSVNGYRSKGLLIFLPLSPNLTIIFFDKSTYKVGNKRETSINIFDEKEINQLNILQILNGNQTIFFDGSVTEKYIFQLKDDSERFQKSNEVQTTKANFKRSNGILEKDSLIVHLKKDSFIKLKIHSLKIHSGCNPKNIDSTKINLRN